MLLSVILLSIFTFSIANRSPLFARSMMNLAELKQMLLGDSNDLNCDNSDQLLNRGPIMKRVDQLMRQPRSEFDAWNAYDLCKKEAASNSHNASLKMRTAEALLAYIRIKTDGNALRVDGHSDSKKNRNLWRKHAPEALSLLQETKKDMGYKPLHAFLYAEAFMYCSCSSGVVKAALKGDAFQFKKNAKALLDKHSSFGSGVGHTFMGAFYLGAPWPVFNAKKSRDHFQAARKSHPNSRRNQYYCGLEALRSGRNAEAKEAFERALVTPCASVEEQDIGNFLSEQCREALRKLKEFKM